MTEPWLTWAQRIAALAQNGLTYTEGVYDRQRYQELREIAAEMFAAHSTLPQPAIVDLFSKLSGYSTPKVDLRGVVFDQAKEKILLVKERSDGRWTLPGGYADVGEAPGLGVVREIFEESGFETKVKKLLAVYDKLKHPHPLESHHTYKLFFLCELQGGSAVPSIETEAVEFFGEREIPALSGERTTLAQIHRMFEHLRHPDWPTDFD